MRRLTILVDMDDVIEDLLGAWVETLNKERGTKVRTEDIRQWNITEAFPTLDTESVYEPLSRDDFWRQVKPIDGASDALKRMIKDGHRVFIVTAAAYETLRARMDHVLFRYFPFLRWDNVIVTSYKQMIRGDVLIDDGIHNLEGGVYEKILMDSPHNRAYDACGNGMTRVKNWDEAYQQICKIAEKK